MTGQVVEPSKIANAIRDLEIGGYGDAVSSLTRCLESVSPGEPKAKDAARLLIIALACQAAVHENAIDQLKPYVRDLIGAVALMAEDGALEQAQSILESASQRLNQANESRSTLEVLLEEIRRRVARRKLTDQWLKSDLSETAKRSITESQQAAMDQSCLVALSPSLAAELYRQHVAEPLKIEFLELYGPLVPSTLSRFDLQGAVRKLASAESPSEVAWREFESARKKAQDDGFIHPDIESILPVLQAAEALADTDQNKAPDEHLRALWQAKRALDAQRQPSGAREADEVSQKAFSRLEKLWNGGHQRWVELAQRVSDAIKSDAGFTAHSEIDWLRVYLRLFPEASSESRELLHRLSLRLQDEMTSVKQELDPIRPKELEQADLRIRLAERGERLCKCIACIDGLDMPTGARETQMKVNKLLAHFVTEKKHARELKENGTPLAGRYHEALRALDISSLIEVLGKAQASGVELFSEAGMSVDLLLEDAENIDTIRRARETLVQKVDEFEQNTNAEHRQIPMVDDALSRITETLRELSADAKSRYAALGEPPAAPPDAMTIAALKESERGLLNDLVKRRDTRWEVLATLLRDRAKKAASDLNLEETDRLAARLEEWAKVDGHPESVATAASDARKAHDDARDKKGQQLIDQAASLMRRANERQNLTPWRRIALLAEAHDYLDEANEVKPGAIDPQPIRDVEAKLAEQEAVLWSRAKAARQAELDELVSKWSESEPEGAQRVLFKEFHRSILGQELPLSFMAGYLRWLEAQRALDDVLSEAAQLVQQAEQAMPSDLAGAEKLFSRVDELCTRLTGGSSAADSAGAVQRLEELKAKLVRVATPEVDALLSQARDKLVGTETSKADPESAKAILDQELSQLCCLSEEQRMSCKALRVEIKSVEDAIEKLDPRVDSIISHFDTLLMMARKNQLAFADQKCATLRLQYSELWTHDDQSSLHAQQRNELAAKMDELLAGNFDWHDRTFSTWLVASKRKLDPNSGRRNIPSEARSSEHSDTAARAPSSRSEARP